MWNAREQTQVGSIKFIDPVLTGKLAIYPTWYRPVVLIRIGAVHRKVAASDLLGGVKDVASSDGTSVHLVVDHLQLGQTDDLEWCLDQATSEEFDGLCAVLAISDVRT